MYCIPSCVSRKLYSIHTHAHTQKTTGLPLGNWIYTVTIYIWFPIAVVAFRRPFTQFFFWSCCPSFCPLSFVISGTYTKTLKRIRYKFWPSYCHYFDGMQPVCCCLQPAIPRKKTNNAWTGKLGTYSTFPHSTLCFLARATDAEQQQQKNWAYNNRIFLPIFYGVTQKTKRNRWQLE